MHPYTQSAPFFFQFSVRPKDSHELFGSIHGCLATIIVFSDSGEKARALAGRHVAANNWEIIKVKRIQLLNQQHIEQMPLAIKKVYTDAQYMGIGALFDTW